MVIGQLTNFPMYLLIELKPIYLLVMKHYTLHDQEISQIVLDFSTSHFKIPLATVECRLKDT